MVYINIQDYNCWICGDNKNITTHHALPQHLKPMQNITIPICEKCHNRLNSDDTTGLYAFAYKLEQNSEKTRKCASKLKSLLENRRTVGDEVAEKLSKMPR